MSKIRVLLADDHAILRSGLKLLLATQPDIEVVGEAGDGNEAVQKALDLRPTVVLMDITMPGMDGLAATRELKRLAPETRVLVLTVHDDPEYVLSLVKAGAWGYLVKTAADRDLLTALRALARGDSYFVPQAARALVDEFFKHKAEQDRSPRTRDLSPRELQVLKLVAEGHTSTEVAASLGLGLRTVETHRAHLMAKLGLENRAELVKFALAQGLLQPSQTAP